MFLCEYGFTGSQVLVVYFKRVVNIIAGALALQSSHFRIRTASQQRQAYQIF